MLRSRSFHCVVLSALAPLAVVAGCGHGGGGSSSRAAIGDVPAVPEHLEQSKIESGAVDLASVVDHGAKLFAANFNTLDGAGRPETTGTGGPRDRRESPENFNRISAPDANSCAGCHNLPRVGGGGDNVANVFVLGQRFPFVNFDAGAGDAFQDHTLEEVANERNTLGMFGSGFVELLAREMTTDLLAIRDAAIAAAAASGSDTTMSLDTKGVNFGAITARPDGTLVTGAVEGVNADLVIRPFHQKGAVVSLREFSNNAFNHHHGMQSSERFGAGVDADNDGHADELTVGDITAASLWQATLPVPGRVLPNDPVALAAVRRGEDVFEAIGCATCHVPFLRLESPIFTEPNPYNPPDNLRPGDVGAEVAVDLTEFGDGPHLSRESDGSVLVPLFSDLKRHDLGDLLNNEKLEQGGIPTREWLTRKLWGAANEPPFLHHGRVNLIGDAIHYHGGEATAARDAFDALSTDDRNALVEFLKTLRVLPEGATSIVMFENGSGIVGDAPTIPFHMEQADIDAGRITLDELREHGQRLFGASFNELDGQGRPNTTGTGIARLTRGFPQNFNRVSAPDADSCAGCHNVPRIGGGGDNVANVFVLGQRFPFVNFDGSEGDGFEDHTLLNVANERNTLGMFGAGYIELLAREMSTDLISIRQTAIADAAILGANVTRDLVTKGVRFGAITARPDGSVDTSAVAGVNGDLIVRPFHQKGVVVSLREFSNNAFNHHHGMQASERFGAGNDADGDGFVDELTVGDITAASVWQANLPVPGRVMPKSPRERAAVDRGEERFQEIGCAECHVPALRLENPVFTEPNPFNPPDNLRVGDVPRPFAWDLTTSGQFPRLKRETDGSVLVPAFTDLKRHDMGPGLDNEKILQGGVPTSQYITRKLWGMANEPPFLHHGRALLISEAILAHGGEAEAARRAYERLSASQQNEIIDFLKTLQVLPEGTRDTVIEAR